MDAYQLRDYIHKLDVEAENLEKYIMDVAIYSEAALSYSEMLNMPLDKIKIFEERLTDKMRKASGKPGTEYL